MPKKAGKKGGGDKMARMTEEEKLLYMQQRAQAEEERARRKEEMLTQFLKDKLEKEEKNSAVNLLKVTQQWRAVLRQDRAAHLRQEIDVLSRTFERVLDRKDNVIKCLVSDLNEVEWQSADAIRSHLWCVDRLLALQKARLASLEHQWKSILAELSSEFNSEREQILSLHRQECKYLDQVILSMEHEYSLIESEALQGYQSIRDDIKHRSIEERHALRVQLEGRVESLWRQVQEAQQSYGEATKDHCIAFEALRCRDQNNTTEIEAKMKRLQKMQDVISTMRVKLNQKESEVTVPGLQSTRDEVSLQVQRLKDQLSRDRAAERSQLANLTVQSNAAATKLQGVIAKGEKLLRLTEMCSKLETEREKLLPFYSSSLTVEEKRQERLDAMEPPSEELAKAAMLDHAGPGRFWQRYNKVLLEQLCLKKEEEELTRENNRLRVLLRQYLDSMSVSEDVRLNSSAILLVSKPPVAAQAARDRQNRQHTVVEAAHVVQHTL
ncbi:dynein regulatory complex subunit 2 [Lampris incognitus]|uniref:dynein regulatory complex subunit 2 n=1 Tax=Lampris incognitus TaxID=2546036 RepID=UPI0024B63220|nr:dynein regulatory complex subunit 2 [Lampris incognitus]